MAVRLSDWLGLVEREYLRRFVPGGGSAIKFVTGDEGVIAEVRVRLESAATAGAFDLIPIDAAATKLHMIHDVFFAVARRINWEASAQRWVETIFKSNGYEWPRPGEPVPIQELSDQYNIAESLLRRQVQ